MFGSLGRVGLQFVLAQAFIGIAGLDRDNAGGPQFDGLFDDEIAAGLFDRGKEQPDIGRQAQGGGLGLANKDAAPLGGLFHGGTPFAVAAIEQGDGVTGAQAHDVEQVIGMAFVHCDGLPHRQRLIYKQPDLSL